MRSEGDYRSGSLIPDFRPGSGWSLFWGVWSLWIDLVNWKSGRQHVFSGACICLEQNHEFIAGNDLSNPSLTEVAALP